MEESKKTALKGMLILITLCVLSSAGGYRLGCEDRKASYDQGCVDGHRAGTDFALMEMESAEAASESEAEDDYARGFGDGVWEGRFQAIEEFGDVLVLLGVKTEAEVEAVHQLIERVRSYDRK